MPKFLRKLLSFEHELLELHLSLLKIMWGIWFLLPFDIYSRVPSTRGLGDVLSENAWGCFFILLGGVQLVAVMDYHRLLKLRAGIAFFSMGLWTMMSIMAFYGSPWSLSGPTTAIFAVSNVLIYLRTRAVITIDQNEHR